VLLTMSTACACVFAAYDARALQPDLNYNLPALRLVRRSGALLVIAATARRPLHTALAAQSRGRSSLSTSHALQLIA
jgi:hypothetical protein